MATTACELTQWKEFGYLDTLAAAQAEAGDFTAAVKYQQQAIAGATDASERKEITERLKLYRNNQPYRERQSYHKPRKPMPLDSAR